VRFNVLSDDGDRLGTISFDAGRFDVDGLSDATVAERLDQRLRELRASGGYDDIERLIRATLERVSADTGARFVRDPDD
jgi:hypothetical protein